MQRIAGEVAAEQPVLDSEIVHNVHELFINVIVAVAGPKRVGWEHIAEIPK